MFLLLISASLLFTLYACKPNRVTRKIGLAFCFFCGLLKPVSSAATGRGKKKCKKQSTWRKVNRTVPQQSRASNMPVKHNKPGALVWKPRLARNTDNHNRQLQDLPSDDNGHDQHTFSNLVAPSENTNRALIEEWNHAMPSHQPFYHQQVDIYASSRYQPTPLPAIPKEGDPQSRPQHQRSHDYQANNNAVNAWFFQACTNALKNHTQHALQKLKQQLYQPTLNVNCKDCDGDTALHRAVKANNLAVVQCLLSHNAIDINSINDEGKTPLHCALHHEWEHCHDVVTAIFKHIITHHIHIHGDPLLKFCIRFHRDVMNLLLKPTLEQDYNLPHMLKKNLHVLLGVACHINDQDLIDFLLPYPDLAINEMINTRFFELRTGNFIKINSNNCLHIALNQPNSTILNKLLNHPHINVNVSNQSGDTFLMLLCEKYKDVAAQKDQLNTLIKLLMDKKLKVNAYNRKTRSTALHQACFVGNTIFIEQLLKINDINPNCGDRKGNTPLHIVCGAGKQYALRRYRRPIAEQKRIQIAKLLLAHEKIKVNQKNKKGQSPLITACLTSNETLVKHLLNHPDIHINVVDHDNNAPIVLACKHEFQQDTLLQLLAHPTIDITLCIPKDLQHVYKKCPDQVANLCLRYCEKKVFGGNRAPTCGHLLFQMANQANQERHLMALLAHQNFDISGINLNGDYLHMCANAHRSMDFLSAIVKHSQVDVNLRNKFGYTFLMLLCKKYINVLVQKEQLSTLIKLLIDKNLKVNAYNPQTGRTALHQACFVGNVPFVEQLLKIKDINPNCGDRKENTPLHMVCGAGEQHTLRRYHRRQITEQKHIQKRIQIAKLLLAHEKIKVNQKNKKGQSPLITACLTSNETLVKHLLNHPDIHVNVVDQNHRTPIAIACEANFQRNTLLQLLAHPTIDITLCIPKDLQHVYKKCPDQVANLCLRYCEKKVFGSNRAPTCGHLLFQMANQANQERHLMALLAHQNFDISGINLNGETYLHMCANAHRSMDFLSAIVKHSQVDVNLRNKFGYTFLMLLCYNVLVQKEQLSTLIKLLIDKNLKVNAYNPQTGRTALHQACFVGNVPFVEQLLKIKDINPNCGDRKENTPLHMVCGAGKQHALRRYHRRPIAEQKRIQIAKLLLAHEKIKVNQKNKKGQSPLITACLTSNETLVKHLLNHPDIHINVFDHDNNAPIVLACKHEFQQDTLLQYLTHPALDITYLSSAELYWLYTQCSEQVATVCMRHYEEQLRYGSSESAHHYRHQLLEMACRANHVHCVNTLLSYQDLNLYAFNAKGETLLSIACIEKNAAIVDILLADPRLSDLATLDEATLCAVYNYNPAKIINLFLQSGKSLTQSLHKHAAQLLRMASAAGHIQTVHWLLSQCRVQDINAVDKDGNTPLAIAISKNHKAIVDLLLSDPRTNSNTRGKKNINILSLEKKKHQKNTKKSPHTKFEPTKKRKHTKSSNILTKPVATLDFNRLTYLQLSQLYTNDKNSILSYLNEHISLSGVLCCNLVKVAHCNQDEELMQAILSHSKLNFLNINNPRLLFDLYTNYVDNQEFMAKLLGHRTSVIKSKKWVNEHGVALFKVACQKNANTFVDLLLNTFAHNMPKGNYYPLLEVTCQIGHISTLIKLLDRFGYEVFHSNKEVAMNKNRLMANSLCCKLLRTAYTNHHLDIVKLLFEHKSFPVDEATWLQACGKPCWQITIDKKDEEIMSYLLAYPHINHYLNLPSSCLCKVETTTSSGHKDTHQLLFELPNINYQPAGYPLALLHIICQSKDFQFINMLLQYPYLNQQNVMKHAPSHFLHPTTSILETEKQCSYLLFAYPVRKHAPLQEGYWANRKKNKKAFKHSLNNSINDPEKNRVIQLCIRKPEVHAKNTLLYPGVWKNYIIYSEPETAEYDMAHKPYETLDLSLALDRGYIGIARSLLHHPAHKKWNKRIKKFGPFIFQKGNEVINKLEQKTSWITPPIASIFRLLSAKRQKIGINMLLLGENIWVQCYKDHNYPILLTCVFKEAEQKKLNWFLQYPCVAIPTQNKRHTLTFETICACGKTQTIELLLQYPTDIYAAKQPIYVLCESHAIPILTLLLKKHNAMSGISPQYASPYRNDTFLHIAQGIQNHVPVTFLLQLYAISYDSLPPRVSYSRNYRKICTYCEHSPSETGKLVKLSAVTINKHDQKEQQLLVFKPMDNPMFDFIYESPGYIGNDMRRKLFTRMCKACNKLNSDQLALLANHPKSKTIINRIVEQKSDVSNQASEQVKKVQNQTLLHLLCMKPYSAALQKCVNLLLDNGADLIVVDTNGDTPFTLAKKRNLLVIADLIQNHAKRKIIHYFTHGEAKIDTATFERMPRVVIQIIVNAMIAHNFHQNRERWAWIGK